jgi:hypothetical protein
VTLVYWVVLFPRSLAFALLFLAGCNQAQTFELLAPPGSVQDAGIASTSDAGGDAGDAEVTVPADSGLPPPPKLPDGAPCGLDSQCEHGECLPHPAFPEGFCTKNNCRRDEECSTDNDVCASRVGPDICANKCNGDGDCRDGYLCYSPSAGEDLVCLPASQKPVERKFDGEPCTRDGDCVGGTCFLDPTWPDGHCTTTECIPSSSMSCNEGTHSAFCSSAYNACLWSCADSNDCREGYSCTGLPASIVRGCVPSAPIEPEEFPFDMTCGLVPRQNALLIDYDIAPDTTSYMITVLTRDTAQILSDSIVLPSGGAVSMLSDQFYMTATAQIQGWVAPYNVPMVEQDASLVEPGRHTLAVSTPSTDACWYLIEERTPGSVIDLDLYFVGVPRLNAASAQNDADFAQLLAETDRIFQQVDLGIGRVRYHDITNRRDLERFSTITSDADFLELMSRSVAPADRDLDSHLSVNVFFVETITIGALGISSALGGPPGLHGTTASGVVSTSEFFRQRLMDPFTGQEIDGDVLSGLIVAHEIGHYLNLYHVSESDGVTHDPVLDTAECTLMFPPEQCGAAGNVMFSSAIGTDFTPGQGMSMKAHPLTKD